MSHTILHVTGLIVGLTVGALVLTQLGPILFFKLPFTTRLMREKVIVHGEQVSRAYRIAAGIFAGLVIAATVGIILVQPRAFPGFLIGMIVIVIVRGKSWGYTLSNLQEYMEAHGRDLPEDQQVEPDDHAVDKS